MKQIKIDGHIFENKYVIVKGSVIIGAVEGLPVKVALGSICSKCQYEIPYTTNFINQNGIHVIVLNENYLTCKMHIIKRLLE